jgi:cellulose synthase (UDP-forming)
MLLGDAHVAAMLLFCGLVILCVFGERQHHAPTRAMVCLFTALAVLTYLDWRFGQFWGESFGWSAETAWMYFFLGVEILCLGDFLIFLLLISRTSDLRTQADRYEAELRAAPPDELPAVDVWIATYNEDWNVLEKTIIGCLNLDWPKDRLTIWVLDDGRREWLREKCEALGVRHLTRPNNKGRKAGNHNHALGATSAPYILSLDSDFIPFPSFIYRTLGFFEDPAVAIVQTPQNYYNQEPMKNNLLLQRFLPEELDMFFGIIQPCRDAWGCPIYVGSAALLRRSALLAVGGFEMRTDIEDQVTSVKLLAHGYRTRYLREKLSVGLTAESIAVLHDQRNRWCRGSLQILFMPYGPFGLGLRLVHRLFFLQSYWVVGPLASLTLVTTPMVLWLFDVRLFPNASPELSMAMPILLFTAISVSLTWLSKRLWLPVVWQAYQLFLSVELLPTALTTLIKPFGKSLIRILAVTPKGDAAGAPRIDRRTFAVLSMILAGTILAFLYRALIDWTGHGYEKIAMLYWTIYNVAVLTVAVFICIELPYRRREERFEVHGGAWLRTTRGAGHADLRDLSLHGARVRLRQRVLLQVDEEILLSLPQIGNLQARAVRAGQDNEIGMRFEDLPDEVRHGLIRELFTVPERHDRLPKVLLWPVAKGLLARFLRAA